MGKAISKKIERIELIKVENTYNNGDKRTYFYNIYLEGIDEPLLVNHVKDPIPFEYIGKKIKFNLNSENEVSNFEIN
jgi:hypothetical protein